MKYRRLLLGGFLAMGLAVTSACRADRCCKQPG